MIHRKGFTLATITALLWGLLPLALKVALTELDAYTITWCRFAGAMLSLGCLLAIRGQLPELMSCLDTFEMRVRSIPEFRF
jgi:drug/metabolite transporter (DMT)-like permease